MPRTFYTYTAIVFTGGTVKTISGSLCSGLNLKNHGTWMSLSKQTANIHGYERNQLVLTDLEKVK